MSQRHFLGIGADTQGRVVPLFAPPDMIPDALSHHCAVVEALRKGPFLPAAFGSVFGCNSAELAGRIRVHRQGLRNALDRSRDLIEMGVTVTPTPSKTAPVIAPSTGRAFLRQAAVRAGSMVDMVAQIDALTKDIAAIDGVGRNRILSDAVGRKSIALAVDRAHACAVAAAIEKKTVPGLTVEVSGPWPLYSFGLQDIFGAEMAA